MKHFNIDFVSIVDKERSKLPDSVRLVLWFVRNEIESVPPLSLFDHQWRSSGIWKIQFIPLHIGEAKLQSKSRGGNSKIYSPSIQHQTKNLFPPDDSNHTPKKYIIHSWYFVTYSLHKLNHRAPWHEVNVVIHCIDSYYHTMSRFELE
jgi:hypothetical protein